ncbi:hypothetical protein [Pseudobacillus badius]|uniref:hypothetical protein n=1 Tax=Bacillus badius TaxID=1455 RepID=UPI0007B3C195|nr:hypothetical protein [Bacillus badius]KZR58872.1 hypothetical protein A3781_15130 [Bacillus badius]
MIKKYDFHWFITVFLAAILTACGGNTSEESKKEGEKVAKQETEKDTTAYTADNAFSWLKESGLVSDKGEDVTEKFKGSEGLVKAISTDEADIMEYKTEENAKKYHNPDLNSYVVKNIYILVKKGQDNAGNFVKVLESGKPLNDLETSYSSDAQKTFVETSQKNMDFLPYVEAFYNIPKKERGNTFDTYVIDKEVTWSGTLADTLSDSVIVYGKPNDYNGENWTTISTEKKDMMPYTFIAELKDSSELQGIKKGDTIKVKGVVGARGDEEMQFNWKLYEGEVVK